MLWSAVSIASFLCEGERLSSAGSVSLTEVTATCHSLTSYYSFYHLLEIILVDGIVAIASLRRTKRCHARIALMKWLAIG